MLLKVRRSYEILLDLANTGTDHLVRLIPAIDLVLIQHIETVECHSLKAYSDFLNGVRVIFFGRHASGVPYFLLPPVAP